MASLVFALLLLAMAGHSSATWCVCKEGMGDSALQKTLDYACGAGADCNPIKPNGQCYNPNTVRAHCNYAVNSYFQKRGQAAGACDFASTATVATSDPSVTGCVYPSSASGGGGGGGGSSTTTTSPTTNTGLPSTGSPIVTTPNGGSLGGSGVGINNGLGPSGNGMNDMSHGGISQQGTLPFITLISYAVASCYWWLQ
ncbi:PREDICTED: PLASMODESMATA CALLOSE-BINDING PROTEIN 3-like isoform X2 [Ipomoea nil]|uniref:PLASMODESMATA CALLOSE-BINDING PROTEIN 3-like isoform X2 n=1 Tax=Ipomoea nil TaxID=35883 RepID=UPI0009019C9B|nr:PREDICTED: PLASMODESMATA CALLOSE-BINDING PROTEIN 3-like isoform X2 [Ipomoea nil]